MIADSKTTPHLRFSGFDAPWEAGTVGTAYRLQGGYAFKSEDFATEGVPVIRISNVTARGIDLSGVKYHPEIRKEHAFVIKSGDLLIAMSGATTGKTCTYWLDQKAYLNQRVGLFRRLDTDHDSRFLTGYVAAKKFQDSLSSLLVAGAQPNIGSRDIESIPFTFPTLPEQRKIADFLTAVDGRIGQLSQKKALLEDYKKGVMQQLFTQALRFKDDHGNDFPEWEEKTLGEIGSVVGGGTPDSTNDAYWNGDVQWFTPTEIRSKFVSRSKRTISTSGLKNCSASVLPAGTLLFTSRATIAEVSIATEPCTTNQGFQSITVNQNVSNEFIYYWVIHFKKEFLRKAQGSTFLEIGGKEVRKMPLLLPSFPEQTKIANFLTALDRKIESVSSQITHTQTFKKGLLQQMFV